MHAVTDGIKSWSYSQQPSNKRSCSCSALPGQLQSGWRQLCRISLTPPSLALTLRHPLTKLWASCSPASRSAHMMLTHNTEIVSCLHHETAYFAVGVKSIESEYAALPDAQCLTLANVVHYLMYYGCHTGSITSSSRSLPTSNDFSLQCQELVCVLDRFESLRADSWQRVVVK